MYVNLTSNLSGSVRRAILNGRECLVAPVTLIVPGVLNGSSGALFYPSDELARDPAAWNGVPIVVYHPISDNGRPVSAKSPGVLRRQGIGVVRGARHNHKLTAEGWFDIENTRRIDKRILYALEEGEPIELSTGLFTDNEPRQGAYKGRRFEYIARNYRPDHLAILPDRTGACSIADGCGVLVNQNPRREDLKMRRFKSLAIPVINHQENCSPALRNNCGCQHNEEHDEFEEKGADFEEKPASPALKKKCQCRDDGQDIEYTDDEDHDGSVVNSARPLPLPVMNWADGASPYLTGRKMKPNSFNG